MHDRGPITTILGYVCFVAGFCLLAPETILAQAKVSESRSASQTAQPIADGSPNVAGVWLGEGRGFSIKLEITQTGNTIEGRKSVEVSNGQLFLTSFVGTTAVQSTSFHDTEILFQTSGGPKWCPAKTFFLRLLSPSVLEGQWDAPPCPPGRMTLKRLNVPDGAETVETKQSARKDQMSTGGNVADLSVSGITLGMTLEQAKGKIGSGFSFQMQKHNEDLEHVLTFAAKSNKEAYILLTQANKLIYIEHFVNFSDDTKTMPNIGTAVASFEAKFGGKPLGNFAAPDNNFYWIYDSKGAIVRPTEAEIASGNGVPSRIRDCAPYGDPLDVYTYLSGGIFQPFSVFVTYTGYFQYPSSSASQCISSAGVIYNGINSDENPLNFFSVIVEDNRSVYNWANKMNSQDKARKDREIERQKKNKIPM